MSELSRLSRIVVAALSTLIVSGPVCSDSYSGLFDPTRPSGWQASESTGAEHTQPNLNALKLQGTFSTAGKRSAMISGQRVGVGDQVGNAEVIGIDRNKVTLRIDGELVELASLLPEVKAPTTTQGNRK